MASRIRWTETGHSREFVLKINKPIIQGPYRLYQESFRSEPRVILEKENHDYQLLKRDGLPLGEGAIYFMEIRESQGLLEGVFYYTEKRDSSEYRKIVLQEGEEFMGIRIKELARKYQLGLKVVYLRGNGIVIIGPNSILYSFQKGENTASALIWSHHHLPHVPGHRLIPPGSG